MHAERRSPIGAELVGAGVSFRVWAPHRKNVRVVLADQREHPLDAEGNGYFSGIVSGLKAGALYHFRLDALEALYPDPASRFQPDGPHGPSQVIDPTSFTWTDSAWPGVEPERRVLYELHVGTFTRDGTWSAAGRELAELARMGITVVEVMPVAEFCGRFGWGYDGVDPFAPTRLYGSPDDFRRFVDRAHACGIGVILDVVYNHFGPDGCYLREFSPHYFTDRYENEWGEPINFGGEHAGPVRELVTTNAAYWIDEFHLDGLRLDATQQIFDASPQHIIANVVERVHASGARRRAFVVCENEPQDVRLLQPAARGGYGADALWNDDFHHAARAASTGQRDGYYSDYTGTPQEFVSAAKWGFLYQGQRYRWQGKRRGTATFGLPATSFVNYLENHDQIANSARGERLHQRTSPGRFRALTALLLLGPQTPLIFQGQEFAASARFLYFADQEPTLAASVRKGRGEFLAQFPGLASAAVQARLANPCAAETFERCKLDLTERTAHIEAYALHCDLLALRKGDPVLAGMRRHAVDGAVLAAQAWVLRYFGADGDDRLLVVNLGVATRLEIVPEPLLAPPAGGGWRMHWSSEDWRYGGSGAVAVETEDGWLLPAEAAVVLLPSA